jgi:hypothetical protein
VRDGKIKPRHKGFIVVRLQGHLPCPTPLPESPTREFSSLDQKPPLWRRKPYTPIYTPINTPIYTPIYTPIFTPIYTPIFTPIFYTPIFYTLHTFKVLMS